MESSGKRGTHQLYSPSTPPLAAFSVVGWRFGTTYSALPVELFTAAQSNASPANEETYAACALPPGGVTRNWAGLSTNWLTMSATGPGSETENQLNCEDRQSGHRHCRLAL